MLRTLVTADEGEIAQTLVEFTSTSRVGGGLEGCYERAEAFRACKFHHKMSMVMIELGSAAGKITFLKRSEDLKG